MVRRGAAQKASTSVVVPMVKRKSAVLPFWGISNGVLRGVHLDFWYDENQG